MLMVSTFKKRALPAATLREVETITAGMPYNGEQTLSSMLSTLSAASSSEREHQKFVPGQTFAPNAGGTIGSDAAGYQVGHVYNVALSTIRSNPLNPRYVYTATAIDTMASSLSAHGQRVSATGFIDESDAVVLIEGETRLRGARAAGLATLRIEIKKRPSTDQALYEEARAANVERKEQTPLDDALRWKELINKKVYPNQRALGLALGYSDEVVSRTVSLASLTPRIIGIIAEYPDLLSLKMLVAVREYAELMGDDAALKLILEIAEKGLSAREVVARRMAAQKCPSRRLRSIREAVTYKGATGEIKAFEKGGRVELSLKGLSTGAAEELTNALRTLLA
jgi:ParB family chromosome partitioning protein